MVSHMVSMGDEVFLMISVFSSFQVPFATPSSRVLYCPQDVFTLCWVEPEWYRGTCLCGRFWTGLLETFRRQR